MSDGEIILIVIAAVVIGITLGIMAWTLHRTAKLRGTYDEGIGF